MKKSQTRVEIEDKDFGKFDPTRHRKTTRGTDGTNILYQWVTENGPQGKAVEIYLINDRQEWVLHKFIRAGESSRPIHGVTFVNSGKK